MPIVGAVADDLTGATTVGVLLSKSGVKTAAIFSNTELCDTDNLQKFDGLIISTDSRALPKDSAYEKVKKATKGLKAIGVEQFSKRTDTTLRGGIGTEIDAMLDELGQEYIAIMVPAMPKSNRIMVGGFSIIEGVPLIKTQVANDVLTPVRENYVPKLISEQSKNQVGLITMESVLAGSEKLKESLIKSREEGNKIILVDAISDEDVDMIAKSLVELKWKVLSVDPGALTESLAVCKKTEQKEKLDKKINYLDGDNNQKPGKFVIIAAGSATEVTKKQMDILCVDQSNKRVHIDALELITNTDNAVADALTKIIGITKKYPNMKSILIETALEGERLDLDETDRKYNLPPGGSSKKINQSLGIIIGLLIKEMGRDRVAGLYMTGGDTMVNVCSMLGVNSIALIDYVIPQTDIGRFIDGEYKNMPFICKGGMTGHDNIVTEIVDRLHNESQKEIEL